MSAPVPKSPPASSKGRSATMSAIRRRDTKPEKELRSLLHALGLRFRVDHRIETRSGRVRPDVVFTRARLAIFVDGCFWHGCPEHSRKPQVNSGYWGPKLDRNRARDRENVAALEADGWTVFRFWEHDDMPAAADQVAAAARR
jgi:DNA mismatch endonuclease, patch repair protein